MRKRCSRNCVIESLTGKTIPHEYPLVRLSLRATALQEITLCLETASNHLDTFYPRMKSIKSQKVRYKQIRQLLRWQLRFFLYHEIAHALIDQLHLSIVGREEDAADTLLSVA
jgi:hypothetical protein